MSATEEVAVPAESSARPDGLLRRSLQARHMSMIAIGGAIGTGLFVASGKSISTAGPGGALLAYALIGVMVYFLMQGLGEMATYLPVAGSFQAYASRFISPSYGFALGWNSWLNWATAIAAELAASSLVMKYWFPDTPAMLWSMLFLALLFGLNYGSARTFGEGEFWFAGIKVITIVVFLVVGVLMILGILGGRSPGFANWTIAEAPFPGGLPAVVSIFLVAGFSFQGTELVGVAAAESKDPANNVPRAVRSVFYRITLFYLGAITVIAFLLPYTDRRLLSGAADNVAVAPFTLVFERAGIAAAAGIMNAVILTSILSAGNSGLYGASRMLHSLALDGKAPRVFRRVNRRGIPVPALLATTAFGMIAFLSSLVGEGVAYTWLVYATGLCGFLAWLGIARCHLRFRRAYRAQGGHLADLPFRARWFPFGPLLALVLCGVVIVGQGYQAFRLGDWQSAAVSYVGLLVFLGLWLGHKVVTGSRGIPPHEADLDHPGAVPPPR